MTVRTNIVAGWCAHLFTVLIGFFLMPFILGTVGEAQYGAWIFINAVAGYSGLIYSGFGATICRYVADLASRREWQQLNVVVSSIQTVYIGAAALVLLFTGAFAWLAPALPHWDALPVGEIQVSILIIGLTIGLGMIGSVYGGVLVGTQRLDVVRGIEVGTGLLRLMLTLLCLNQQYGLITLALIFLVVTVMEHAVAAVFAYREVRTLSIAPWWTRKRVVAECFGFSAFNALALLAEYLIFFTDTVIIGLLLGPVAVVPYQIGLRIAQMIQVPIARIGEAVLPKAGELHARGARDELARLVTNCMGLSLLLSCGFYIGATYFGELLIETWIGQGHGPAGTVLTILVAAQVVALPMVVVRKALLGCGDVRVPAFIDLGEALLNLVLSLMFIQWWGIVGVAWGTLVPLTVVELGLFLPYAMRQLGLTDRNLIRRMVAPQLPALASLLLFCQLAESWTPRSGWSPLMVVTLVGGAVLIGVRWLTYQLVECRTRSALDAKVARSPGTQPTSESPATHTLVGTVDAVPGILP